ncbi:MAG: hypothetical protein H0V92_04970 [Pseudonocardiales bacterium]|nr:hypothetical protein [Pseudonocardiales bacterium]
MTPTGFTTSPGTALLLPRLLSGRGRGPVFLADRRPTRAVPGLDLCPVTGHARLSYRRAAELFEHASQPLAGYCGTGPQLNVAPATALRADP